MNCRNILGQYKILKKIKKRFPRKWATFFHNIVFFTHKGKTLWLVVFFPKKNKSINKNIYKESRTYIQWWLPFLWLCLQFHKHISLQRHSCCLAFQLLISTPRSLSQTLLEKAQLMDQTTKLCQALKISRHHWFKRISSFSFL